MQSSNIARAGCSGPPAIFEGYVLAGLIVAAVTAVEEPLDDAIAARQHGDYATALRLLQPLAEQGNAPDVR
jgi:hypothetical protein